MFKRIAVALDGSDCAQQAFSVALQLARAEQAELGICSVIDPILIAGTAPPSPAMDIVIRDMEIEARRLVTDGVARAQRAGLTASGHTCSGVPAFELLKYAGDFKADLIVMGTHGRHGISHFLMGSVAEVVLRESSVPVLVVRGPVPGKGSTDKEQRAEDAENRKGGEHRGGHRAGATA